MTNVTNDARTTRQMTPAYFSLNQSNTRLNARKNQPNVLSAIRPMTFLSASRGLSNNAHNAGDSVSDTNVEIAVDAAMVNAN